MGTNEKMEEVFARWLGRVFANGIGGSDMDKAIFDLRSIIAKEITGEGIADVFELFTKEDRTVRLTEVDPNDLAAELRKKIKGE